MKFLMWQIRSQSFVTDLPSKRCEGKDDITESRIIKGMVGREIADRFPKREPKIGEVLMEVKTGRYIIRCTRTVR